MWNDRFNTPDYVFGTEPAEFLHRAAPYLSPGQTALSVADGEGRNAVWLAGQGLHVTAMDGAPNALEKARALAEARGVQVDFRLGDITTWDWDAVQYDVVVGIFIQFAGPALRDQIFVGLKRALKPGGLVLLHGYTPKQVEYGTGGPRAVENMYTADLLTQKFAGFTMMRLEEFEAEVDEGRGHSGHSALIDMIARKEGA